MHPVPESLEVIQGELFHLMGCVSTLEALTKAITLHCLRDNDGWLAFVRQSSLVGRVDLLVVVATTLEAPNLVIAVTLNKLLGSLVTGKEVVANEPT